MNKRQEHLNELRDNAVAMIEKTGMTAYMRKENDSYAYFSDGQKIGTIQWDPAMGYTISSVHKPDRVVGSGYQIHRHTLELTEAMLVEAASTRRPHWDHSPMENIRKFDGWNEFAASNNWNADYAPVTSEMLAELKAKKEADSASPSM